MLQVQQRTVFNFSMAVGETTYNFSIPAETRAEASVKLIGALREIIEAVDKTAKPGAN